MLAVAYCYLVSVYAKLTLHSLQFADNVGWCTTTSFISPQAYFDYETLFISVLFNRFWHFAYFQNAQRHVARLYIFSFSRAFLAFGPFWNFTEACSPVKFFSFF